MMNKYEVNIRMLEKNGVCISRMCFESASEISEEQEEEEEKNRSIDLE